MKTISMSYKEYEEESHQIFICAEQAGISKVMKFLESGKRFYDWYEMNLGYEPNDNWKRILKCLGRDNELKPISDKSE